MRWLTILLGAAVVVGGVAACGGEEAAAPLTLEQRVANESDAPGSEADPVETRIVVRGADNVQQLSDALITATAEDAARLRKDGFVAAIVDTRFFPAEPGASHHGDEPHVNTLVAEFATEEGAADAVALLRDDGLEPCPGKCAADIGEFEVDGVPDAAGVARVTTAESLEETGEDGHPFAEYTILFSDGVYAYSVTVFGPPEEVSEERVQEIARDLYERVRGAPPPEST